MTQPQNNFPVTELTEKPLRNPPPPRFQLLIDCRSEAEQQALYELFRGDGLRCRVLVTA